MSASPQPSAQPRRLADRLLASQRKHFVGRNAERELFLSALLGPELPFAVLYLHGPGGVGKTTLLAEFAREAAGAGVPVLRIDRAQHPTFTGQLSPGVLARIRR